MSPTLDPVPSAPWRLAAAIALGIAAVGCGSPPPPRLHSLLPPPDAAAPPPMVASPGWDALTVSIPPQVDRPQWVLRQADGSLAEIDGERWAGPLTDEIAAAIADRLRRAAPATSLPPGQNKPWRIAVDIQRFESAPNKSARIDAEWSLRPTDSPGWRCRGAFEQPAGASVATLAAAHRAALVQLGDAVARGLAAALAGATTPVCAAG